VHVETQNSVKTSGLTHWPVTRSDQPKSLTRWPVTRRPGSISGKSYALHRMAALRMTLSDLVHPKSSLFYVLGPPSFIWNGWSQSLQILYSGRLYHVLASGWKTTLNGRGQVHATHFTRTTLASAGIIAVVVCLSVRPSITSRRSTEMVKRRITQTTSHDSPGTLVFWRRKSWQNSNEITSTDEPNAGAMAEDHFNCLKPA